ncbi:MAG: hypothetical protein KME21_10400 [Desmonostoc vinosum HA7617-LM4]|nr:hypothetical protein [Desmonostoc vinosum HA7617-LM4]
MKQIQDSYKNHISLKVTLLQPTPTANGIVPLQPQKEKILSGWERLAAQAERINQIAKQLELAILEFRAIASTLNNPPLKQKPSKSIDQNFAVSVPWIRQKSDKSLLLTTRKVDLYQAEKEAALLAQQLRQQTKKRLASQQHRKNENKVEYYTKR